MKESINVEDKLVG